MRRAVVLVLLPVLCGCRMSYTVDLTNRAGGPVRVEVLEYAGDTFPRVGADVAEGGRFGLRVEDARHNGGRRVRVTAGGLALEERLGRTVRGEIVRSGEGLDLVREEREMTEMYWDR